MNFYRVEGILTLVATEEITEEVNIASIHLNATASGAFVFELGGATITITTIDTDIQIQRRVGSLKLVSGPAGASLTAFLQAR